MEYDEAMDRVDNRVLQKILAIVSFFLLMMFAYNALTRFHTGIDFSSWEIVANATTLFSLFIFGVVAVRLFPLQQRSREWILWSLLWVVIVCTIVIPVFGNMFSIQGMHRVGYHDGAVQTDVAFEELLKGENPYTLNFGETRFGELYGRLRISNNGDTIPNPALTQYIYLPGTLIQGALNAVQKLALGITDARPIMLVSMLLAAFLLVRMVRQYSVEVKMLIVTVFVLNPVYLRYLLEGANDTFLLFLIVSGVFLLEKKSMRGSGLVLGLSFATKHFAWFFLPFLAVYVYNKWKQGEVTGKDVKRLVTYGSIVCAACILPFVFWSPSAFIQDTVFYAAGSGSAVLFPITGYGFSQLLTLFGVPIQSHFPFFVVTLPVTVLLVWLGSRFVYKHTHLSSVVSVTAFTLFGYIFFSRMMNENYLGLVVGLLIVAGVMYVREQYPVEPHAMQATESSDL